MNSSNYNFPHQSEKNAVNVGRSSAEGDHHLGHGFDPRVNQNVSTLTFLIKMVPFLAGYLERHRQLRDQSNDTTRR